MTKDKAEYIKNWLFRANEDIAVIKSLTDFGVSMRYPDDFYIPEEKEALQYRDTAISAKEIVERLIK